MSQFTKSGYVKTINNGQIIDLPNGLSWFSVGNANANETSSYKLYLPDDVGTLDNFALFTDMAYTTPENMPMSHGSSDAIRIECISGTINVSWRD